MNNSEVHLIQNTGISPSNYKYWESKEACDSWFLGKSKQKLEDYSYIRGDQLSKNGYNVGCVHVNLPYSTTTDCDYISYKNRIFEDRWFHCQVVNREYVNEDSTRLYFVIDYVASYWDTLDYGTSFVERTHVGDDWKSKGTETASKYLLPEPFSIECRPRPDLLLDEPFKDINLDLFYDHCKFNLVTTVSDSGEINNPEIFYQSGASISGYLYSGTDAEITEKLKKYVTFSSQLVVRAESILNHVSSIYLCPESVIGNTTNTPEYTEIDKKFQDIIDYSTKDNQPFVRHAKVLDYFRIRIVCNTSDILLSPAEYGSRLWGNVAKTGGPNGCYTFMVNDSTGVHNGVTGSTMPWPKVSVAATVNAYEYRMNDKAKEFIKENSSWFNDRSNLGGIL